MKHVTFWSVQAPLKSNFLFTIKELFLWPVKTSKIRQPKTEATYTTQNFISSVYICSHHKIHFLDQKIYLFKIQSENKSQIGRKYWKNDIKVHSFFEKVNFVKNVSTWASFKVKKSQQQKQKNLSINERTNAWRRKKGQNKFTLWSSTLQPKWKGPLLQFPEVSHYTRWKV